MLGGESKQVEPVTEAILDEGARLRREGINPDLFRRCKKAAYGSRVRALELHGPRRDTGWRPGN